MKGENKMNMNRRGFLSAMLAAGAYPLLPGCFSSKAYVANEKVRLAAIGCGAQAWFDLKKLAGNGDICEVVALCDTDIGAPHTEEALERFPDLPRSSRSRARPVNAILEPIAVTPPTCRLF